MTNLSAAAQARKRIAVLYTSCDAALKLPDKLREAEDLTATGRLVQKALRSRGHIVRCIRFGHSLLELLTDLRSFKPEVVFNLAEAPAFCYEKEPHAAAVLELLGLPYTGNGPLTLGLCKNKARTKEILQAHDIPTPKSCVYSAPPQTKPALAFPLVVKPLCQDGSLGITEESVVNTWDELRRGVAYVLTSQRQDALVEEFVDGREFNVSVLGNGSGAAPYRILPPGEFVYHNPRWRVCTFDAKWDEAHPSYAAVEAVQPATISQRLTGRLQSLTLQCAKVFEMSGYARLDFRLDAKGRPQLFDVNPNPDVAPGMGIAKAAEGPGLSYPDFLEELVRLGLERGPR